MTKENITRTALTEGNEALRNKNYPEAIKLYFQALQERPELAKLINANIEIAQAKYAAQNNGKKLIPHTSTLADSNHPNSSSDNPKTCILKFDQIDLKFASGWAMCHENKEDRVFLRVDLNGRPLHIVDTTSVRKDVQKVHGGDGFVGYKAELSEYLDFSGTAEINVASITHQPTNKEKIAKKIPNIFTGAHFSDINEKAKHITNNYEAKAPTASNSIFSSLIILNLNGLGVLKRCINSIYENTKSIFEVIVIDHGSTDGSIDYLESSGLKNLKLIKRGKNYSFSESNNFAAQEAKGDVLIFLNNDMIIEGSAIAAMATAVTQTNFGLIGIKLWDMPSGIPESTSRSLNVVQHIGVHFRQTHRSNVIEAIETRPATYFDIKSGIYETPAVTAAMMAIKKSDFVKIKGFDPAYFYGQEDVDFCLKYMKANLGKTGVLLDHGAYHARGLTRRILSQTNTQYVKNNREILERQMGAWFRKRSRTDIFETPGFWNTKPCAIAMIVSEIGFETDKADYFTARELGDAIEAQSNFAVGYFNASVKEIDVNGYDAVIVFIDGFDPSRLINLSPSTLLVGWARNWFDRWCERTWIHMYDLLFTSSEFSRGYMEERLKRKVGLLRIAASQACIENKSTEENYKSDYCFTGSFFNSPRDITACLNASELPYDFKVFGHNWEEHPSFRSYTQGPVGYLEIPKIYASSRLVIDDANIATQKWGSINCRVYDSLASGVMCITNNIIGTKEIFSSEFPTYQSKEELHQHIKTLLTDNNSRKLLIEKYRKVILENHTYSHRASDLINALINENKKTKIAIKISAPTLSRSAAWGDMHYAICLQKHFEELGYKVRIDCMDQWYSPRSSDDDVALVLRGLDRYKTRDNQINILWLISHPDLVTEAEIRSFQKIYVASETYTEKLKEFIGIESIEYLPQATDFSETKLDIETLNQTPSHEILFVGNSRGEYREVVKLCVTNNLPIAVYGNGWKELIPEKYIVSEYIENEKLPYYYNKAKIVLSDHWEDMKRRGFISNRVYDVIGSGGTILTDHVEGINNIQSDQLYSYQGEGDFINKVHLLLSKPSNSRKIFNNTIFFKSRAHKISAQLDELLYEKGIREKPTQDLNRATHTQHDELSLATTN